MTRPQMLALLFATAAFAAGGLARAQTTGPVAPSDVGAPLYTLEVETDAGDVIAFELVEPRLAQELGSPVARSGAVAASRAALTVRYRDGLLTVRAVSSSGQVLERIVRAEGDAATVLREAVLLAGNLARDESRELIDELAARRSQATPPPSVAPEPPASDIAPAPAPATALRTSIALAFVYPLATNYGEPDVRSTVSLSLLYGRVGHVDAFALGFGITHASRRLDGVQVGGLASVVTGDARGVQMAIGANVATESLVGVQGAVVNVGGDVTGAQVGLVNVGKRVKGLQLGIVNVADEVDGAAIGLVSIARDLVHPVAWVSNLAYTTVGLKFATKYVYTITAIGFGTNEVALQIGAPSFTAALGAHIPVAGAFDLEPELAYSDLDFDAPSEANRALHPRVLAGYAFARRLRLFAGGGLRAPIVFDRGTPVVRPEGVIGVQF